MEPYWITIVVSVLVAALTQLLMRVFGKSDRHDEAFGDIRREISDLKIKLAEEYPKDGAMRFAVAAAIEPLKVAIAEQARTLQHQGRLLEAIARQMHIPAVIDD